jgi:hypothetical protein
MSSSTVVDPPRSLLHQCAGGGGSKQSMQIQPIVDVLFVGFDDTSADYAISGQVWELGQGTQGWRFSGFFPGTVDLRACRSYRA